MIERVRSEEDALRIMAEEVRAGLSDPAPWLPCKYFYDDRGSRLFEEITRLPEYYQTRTEERILETLAPRVVQAVEPTELVEIGSGAGRKTRLLLEAMAARGSLEACLLFDIHEPSLRESTERLGRDYPGLRARGLVGDFERDLEQIGPGTGRRLAAFFAGTLGNLHPRAVPGFFRRLAGCLSPGDAFLVGVDLVKDEARLVAAYNDRAGVTAEFNRNILRVLNDRLGADFDPGAFDHVAFYDRGESWIEMRLRARRRCRVRVPGALVEREFHEGDEIRTEISCKYTEGSLRALWEGSGLEGEGWVTDPEALFALALLRRTGEPR